MIEMKTSELIGPALDWAVAKAEGYDEGWLLRQMNNPNPVTRAIPAYSTDWGMSGPLLKPNRISLTQKHSGWVIACIYDSNDEPTHMQLAEDPLIAAMRCLCASKLGDTVQVPQELLP